MAKNSRQKILKTLDIIMDPRESGAIHGITTQLANYRTQEKRWINNTHIVGYGTVSSGTFYRNKKGPGRILIYTDSTPGQQILSSEVPSKLRLPSIDDKVKTEIVNIGEVQPQLNDSRQRPVRPGTSISNINANTGTLGLVVEKVTGEEKGVFLLSNFHVLTNFGAVAQGDVIVQPGTDDGGSLSDKIGELHEVMPLQFHDREMLNTADAALARVVDMSLVTPDIMGLGAPEGTSNQIRRGMRVRKSGRTSAVSVATVLDPAARIRLPYHNGNRHSTSRVGFKDVVLTTPFSWPGDSGAAVVSENSTRVVGLVMAGSSRASVFCKIQYIFEYFKIKIRRI